MLTSISVLVPAYNEAFTVKESLKRLLILTESHYLKKIQVIVVDDGSKDGTTQIIEDFLNSPETKVKTCEWIFVRHQTNLGKSKGAYFKKGQYGDYIAWPETIIKELK